MRQWVLFSGFTNVKMEVNQGRIQEFVQGGGLAPIAPPPLNTPLRSFEEERTSGTNLY